MPNDPRFAAAEMRRLTAARSTSLDPAWFEIGERTLTPMEVVHRLRPYLTVARMARIEQVLDGRTQNLTVVVEGMVDTGNIAAVMRTADGFGIQDFHTIATARSYKHSRRTSQGAEKWLDRYRWTSAAGCLTFLRARGMRIVAAHLDDSAAPIDDVDFSIPTALVFGNELSGLSHEVLALADSTVMVPIDGFVQSYNISVAAAVCLAQARRHRRDRLGRHGDLSDDVRERLRALWYLKSVPHAADILERLLADEEAPAG